MTTTITAALVTFSTSVEAFAGGIVVVAMFITDVVTIQSRVREIRIAILKLQVVLSVPPCWTAGSFVLSPMSQVHVTRGGI